MARKSSIPESVSPVQPGDARRVCGFCEKAYGYCVKGFNGAPVFCRCPRHEGIVILCSQAACGVFALRGTPLRRSFLFLLQSLFDLIFCFMLLTFILTSFVSSSPVPMKDTVDVFAVDTTSVNSVVIIPEVKDTVEVVPSEKEFQTVIETLTEDEVQPVIPKHLKFKDIDIDGGPAAFGKALEGQGYRVCSSTSYRGAFAGVENALITPHVCMGTVWKVGVVFPPNTHWIPIKEQYVKFKNWFAWKYVIKPSNVREQLSSRFREGTGQEAWGFESGAAVYRTVYDLQDGRVIIYVAYDQASGGMKVCIDYIDRINSIIKEETDMMDL